MSRTKKYPEQKINTEEELMHNWLVSLSEQITQKELEATRGVNKSNEIKRLVFEILKAKSITREELLNIPQISSYIKSGRKNFRELKEILLKIRFPLSSEKNDFHIRNAYLPPLSRQSYGREARRGIYYPPRPKNIFVEKEAYEFPLTKRILEKLSCTKPRIIESIKQMNRRGQMPPNLGKDSYFLIRQRYDILKPCPCSKNVVCCGYHIFNIGSGCPFDCSYCYLQHYLNFPGITLPVNTYELLEKLLVIVKNTKIPQRRIGTGEFTDSLALEEATEYGRTISEFFRKNLPDYLIELKTKSDRIEPLLESGPAKNTVISWTLSPQKIIETEEYLTPSLARRVECAKTALEAGFSIAFHFDPIFYYEGWEKDYREVVELMGEKIGNSIKWISLGTFRFYRGLKKVVEKRFPTSKILNGELLIHTSDNKLRYPEFIRHEVYSKMAGWIKKVAPDCTLYLCMEPMHMWKKIKGLSLDFKK